MFKVFIPSQETYVNHTRPMIYESIGRVLRFFNLENSGQVYFNGEAEISKLIGNDHHDGLRSDQFTDGVFRKKIFAVANIETTDFDTGYSNSRRVETERPSFIDIENDITITPVFETRRVEVELNAHFPSKITAQEFRNAISLGQAKLTADFNLSAQTHFVLNEVILALLENIHQLLKKNDDTTPELGEWFKERSKVPFTTISNKAGNNKALAQTTTFSNIGIQFQEPKILLAQKSDIFGKYEVNIPYFFYLPEFIGWSVEYPLNIYQDEIDSAFIPKRDEGRRPFSEVNNVELSLVNMFAKDNRVGLIPYYHILPSHDFWRAKHRRWAFPLIQARLVVEDLDKQEVCNIFEIPGFNFNPLVKRFILRNKELCLSMFECPIVIQLFSEDIPIEPDQLSLGDNGELFLHRRPTLANTHRVVISVSYGIRDWDNGVWEDLDNNPDDKPFLNLIFPWFDRWGDFIYKPLTPELPTILGEIDKGDSPVVVPWNHYMMLLGLEAYTDLR